MEYMKFATLELYNLLVSSELVEANRTFGGLLEKQITKRKVVEISQYLVIVSLAHTLVHSASVDFSTNKRYYYTQESKYNKRHNWADD